MERRPWELMVCVVLASPCSDVNGFVLSLVPELGTMGSKWGGVGVTRSSTSYDGCVLANKKPATWTGSMLFVVGD